MTLEPPRHGAVSTRPAAADLLFLLVALAFSAAVYGPIVGCYFFADDFLNLYQIANFDLARYLLTPNGGHVLLSRNAVFYLSHALFGTAPQGYYASALLLHLVNVALLFELVRLLTGRRGLACFAAALWGTSPLNQGTLGWYAVFGQVIGATTTLIILCRAQQLAARDRWPGRGETIAWYGLALIGATSFGTGLALAMALPFALWWLLPRTATNARRLPPLVALPVLVPLLYVALLTTYAAVSGESAAAQSPPPAMLADGVAIAEVLGRLLGLGLARLLLGYAPGVAPDWRLVLLAFAAAVTLATAAATPRVRRQIAVFLALGIACYGAIAAARATILLSFDSDVISTITRYHYVGQLFLAVAFCLLLLPLCQRVAPALRHLALGAWYVAALPCALVLAPAIDTHADARRRTEQALVEIRRAVRARPAGTNVVIPNKFFRPLPLPGEVFPGRAALFTIFFAANSVDGRRVYFVEKRPATLRAALRGRRTQSLLIPPSALPATESSSLPSAAPRR